MDISSAQLEFLASTASAAMITVGDDGSSKAVRVGIALVDGKLWSSGTQDRVRTARLRLDPHCSLFVFDAAYRWLTLETSVSLLEGADVPELSVRMFRQMQKRPEGPLNWFGKELSPQDFIATMRAEQRLIYEFEINHAYGLI